jgi:hypothetical protein
VSLYVIPDPDVITSGEAQEVPGYGVFPVAVAATSRSADEWRKAIKDDHLHLAVVDIRKLTDAHKGTAVELAMKNAGEIAPAAEASETTTPRTPHVPGADNPTAATAGEGGKG